jgi:CRP/FNR family transcriptional regulator, cyclic AMP receptor protein
MSCHLLSDPRVDATAGLTPPALLDTPVRPLPELPPRPQVAVEALAAVPLLQPLEPALLRQLAARAVLRRLPRQATVLEQGSRESGLYVLLQGQLQVVRRGHQGRTLVIDQLRPGDHFGELSAIDGQAQSAAVRCSLPSEVLVVSRGDFLDTLDASRTLLPALLLAMVQRMRRKSRRITLLALHDVRGCVVQQLLDLAELQDGRPVVRGRLCRQTIAGMVGASRAMVSRVMMDLVRAGDLETLPDGATAVHCQAIQPDSPPPRRQSPRRAARG